jgi:putative ABC transport system substrate-binding protein
MSGVRRREFFIALIGLTVVRSRAARAQQSAKAVGGFLSSLSRDPTAHLTAGFLRGLGDAGFVDGQNVVVEYRWAEGQYDRLPKLAAELVDHPVAVLFAAAPPAALAAKAATTKIPVVFVSGDDPIRSGLVERLNQPGGNVTGVSVYSGSQLGAKHIELLHELVSSSGSDCSARQSVKLQANRRAGRAGAGR